MIQAVREDLEKKGYRVVPAIQYGCDFAVYKDDTKHSQWLVWVLSENRSDLTVLALIALSRVAHSVNKKLVMALPLANGGVRYTIMDGWK